MREAQRQPSTWSQLIYTGTRYLVGVYSGYIARSKSTIRFPVGMTTQNKIGVFVLPFPLLNDAPPSVAVLCYVLTTFLFVGLQLLVYYCCCCYILAALYRMYRYQQDTIYSYCCCRRVVVPRTKVLSLTSALVTMSHFEVWFNITRARGLGGTSVGWQSYLEPPWNGEVSHAAGKEEHYLLYSYRTKLSNSQLTGFLFHKYHFQQPST